jgi:hypothetical protein
LRRTLARFTHGHLDVREHVGRALVALRRILTQRFRHDAFQHRWDTGFETRHGFLLLVAYGVRNRVARIAVERTAASNHFIQNNTERKEIRAVVDGLPLGLLGRHVARRTPRCTGVRHLRGTVECCQSKIEHFRLPAVGHQNVRRLDVAVNDTDIMSHSQCITDLPRKLQRSLYRQRVGCDQFGERTPLDALHDNEILAVGIFDGVDGDNIGVRQAGCGLSLAQQSGPRLGTMLQAGRKELDGDVAVEPGVVGEIHLTHTTLAKLVANSIVEDLFTLHGCKCSKATDLEQSCFCAEAEPTTTSLNNTARANASRSS